jgi:hypothetical protein
MSTSIPVGQTSWWREAGHRYHPLGGWLRRRFGRRVQKVSVDGGFTCPNVDGTVAVGGCVFCDNRSFSPSRRAPRAGITQQLERGIRLLKHRYDVDRFFAYFQPATNTYAPVERLRPLYEEALAHPKVVGLAIGTRPDCVPDDVLDLIEELARRTYVSLELGLQTIHDRSLDWMNRGHHHEQFVDAVARARGRGFSLCAHVILGLPGESRECMRATAREVARQGLDAVKVHNLYVVRGTPMEADYRAGKVPLLSLPEYASLVADFLELLPPEMVIERTSGEAPGDYLVAPDWCRDKPAIRHAILDELARRDSWQGKCRGG